MLNEADQPFDFSLCLWPVRSADKGNETELSGKIFEFFIEYSPPVFSMINDGLHVISQNRLWYASKVFAGIKNTSFQ